MKELNKILELGQGITSFVGGGGKTTAIYKLAKELSLKGEKVIVTTTTKMFIPEANEVDQLLINPNLEEIKGAFLNHNRICVAGSIVDDKIHFVEDDKIGKMKNLADYVFVEADGSKRLPIKVAGDCEPVIPRKTDHVIIVIGLTALKGSIGKVCFRKEKAMKILGVNESHYLTIKDILKLIKDPNGLSKEIENYKSTLVLNQSDVLTNYELMELKNYFKKEISMPVIVASLQKEIYEKI